MRSCTEEASAAAKLKADRARKAQPKQLAGMPSQFAELPEVPRAEVHGEPTTDAVTNALAELGDPGVSSGIKPVVLKTTAASISVFVSRRMEVALARASKRNFPPCSGRANSPSRVSATEASPNAPRAPACSSSHAGVAGFVRASVTVASDFSLLCRFQSRCPEHCSPGHATAVIGGMVISEPSFLFGSKQRPLAGN